MIETKFIGTKVLHFSDDAEINLIIKELIYDKIVCNDIVNE